MYALLIKGLVQGFRIEASHGYMGDLEFLTESMADAAPGRVNVFETTWFSIYWSVSET